MKKITRKDKVNKTKEGICYKCNTKLIKEFKIFKCSNCGFEIVILS